ncbi:MAG: DNA-directed RNA polymerase subunit alpha [Synergistaceae bacterium]|nr:DNA-directed RNA polymerase subunit alpha [Synergistaceae bacterium]
MESNNRFKIFIDETKGNYGRLFIEPLERGYGDTLGNALRRLLLSSIKGAAVTAVRIDGVLHEFSTIKGVREDVIEILMNLKHVPIRAKHDLPPSEYKILTLDSKDLPDDFFTRENNPGVLTVKDLSWDNDFEFVDDPANKNNGVICTLEPGADLLLEIYVEQGVGYLSAERERPAQPPLPLDAMLADAIFSPVTRVNYEIEPARVGQSIDYERLILEVWTNGTISPQEAVEQAAKIAESYFKEIAENVANAIKNTTEPEPPTPDNPDGDGGGNPTPEPEPDDKDKLPEIFSHPIHELELSIRSENCLLRGGMNTIGDLIMKSRDDLLKIRNLGRKSLTEIEEKIASLGFNLAPSKPGANPEGENTDSAASEVESDSKSELEAIFESDTESEQAPEKESKPKAAKSKSKSKAKAKSEPEPEIKPESEPESESESEPEAKPKKKRTTKKSKEVQ